MRPVLGDLRLGRALAGSLATGLGLQLTLVVSGILAARLLGAEDRGHLALLALVPSLIGQLGGAGLPLAVTQAVASDPDGVRPLTRLVTRVLAVQGAILLVVHALVLAVLVAGSESAVRTAAAVTLLWIPAHFLLGYALSILQGERRFGPFNLLRLAPSAAYAAVLVALFAVGVDSLPIVAAAATVPPLLVGAVAAVLVLRGLPARVGESAWPFRRLLGFGVRSQLGSMSPVDTFRLDQVVVAAVFSPAVLGIYVVAVAFTNLPRFLAQSIGMVAAPAAARSSATGQASSVRRLVWAGTVCCAAVAGALLLAMPWLVRLLFGSEFASAAPVAQILVVGAFFLGVRRILTDAVRGTGRPTIGAVAELSALGCLAVTLPLLVPLWGVEGVAASLAISSALSLGVLVAAVARPGQAASGRSPVGVVSG